MSESENNSLVGAYSSSVSLPEAVNQTLEQAIGLLSCSSVTPYLAELISECKGDFKAFNLADVDNTPFSFLKNSIGKLLKKCFKYGNIADFKKEDAQIDKRLSEINEMSFTSFQLKNKENAELVKKINRVKIFNSRLCSIDDCGKLLVNSLVEIRISNNLLSHVNLDIFSSSLKTLDLSHNLIKSVEYSSNHKLSSLESLDLSFNLLTNLKELIEIVQLNNIPVFNFHANPLPQDTITGYIYNTPNNYILEHKEVNLRSQTVFTSQNIAKFMRDDFKQFEIDYDTYAFTPVFKDLSDVGCINQKINKKQLVLLNNAHQNVFPGAEKGIKVNYLYLNNNSIKTLENLSYFESLKELHIQNNRICSLLGIFELVNLEVCDFSNNLIEELYGLGSFPNLKVLNVENNRVKHLEGLFDLSKIKEVYLAANKIESIRECVQLRKTKSLRILDLTSNSVSSNEEFRVHMIFYCPFISTLNRALISRGDLELAKEFFEGRLTPEIIEGAIGMIPQNEVEEINLSDNRLKDVDSVFSKHTFPRLKRLNIKKNKFQSIKIFGPSPNLMELDMSFNRVEKLLVRSDKATQRSLLNLQNLEKLDLSHNSITDYTGVQLLKNLKIGLFNNNCISKLDGFDGMPNLVVLDVSNNRLRSCERSNVGLMPSLKAIILDNNYLKSVNGLVKLSQLCSISLVGNKVSDFFGLDKVQQLDGLVELNLSHNPICNTASYRAYTLRRFPQISKFDGAELTKEDRDNAMLESSLQIDEPQDELEGALSLKSLADKVCF